MNFRKFYIPTVIAGLALLTCANQAQAQTTSDLTGTWSCAGTPNYIRQVGSELWDLNDGGTQFTNVLYGTVLNGFINGTWADLPKAGYTNYGYVSGKVVSATQITLTSTTASTGGQVNSETCTRP